MVLLPLAIMPKNTNRSVPFRRAGAVVAKRRAAKAPKAKDEWIMTYFGVMPDLGDPIAIQRALRRERR